MSDLTERLRAKLENHYWEYGTRALQAEAADRIEELEAAIRHAYGRQDTDSEGALNDLLDVLEADDE